jgi:DNA polymerase III epsilon subunit-like protein
LDYVVFDFETGGLNPQYNEAIQVAGKAYNARTLEPYPAEQGGEFCSLMKPLYPERLEDGALKVNKKTREELMVAPDQAVVWNQFVDWVARWNPKKTKWTAPIACGKNIRSFDLEFVKVLNNLHCKKKDKVVLFSERREVDMQDFTFAWFENEAEPEDDKMDTWRKYLGLSSEGGHDALVDVRQTGAVIMRFLKLHRQLQARKDKDGNKLIKFKGAFAGLGI